MINPASALLCVRFFILPCWTCGAVQGEFFSQLLRCPHNRNFTLKALDIPETMVQFKVWLQKCVYAWTLAREGHFDLVCWTLRLSFTHSLCVCLHWCGCVYGPAYCTRRSGVCLPAAKASLTIHVLCSPPPPFSSPLSVLPSLSLPFSPLDSPLLSSTRVFYISWRKNLSGQPLFQHLPPNFYSRSDSFLYLIWTVKLLRNLEK